MQKIKVRRGLKANLPVLDVGELAYCTDTEELFIGTFNGNNLINDSLGNTAPENHTHEIIDIVNLQTALDSKSNTNHIHNLKSLSDVISTGLINGYTLVYNSGNQKFEPALFQAPITNEITLGNYRISYNATTNSLDFISLN